MKPTAVDLEKEPVKLADVVFLRSHGTYSQATVTQIEDGQVSLFRPYVHTADFKYTGGVIPYIGIETFQVPESNFAHGNGHIVVERRTEPLR